MPQISHLLSPLSLIPQHFRNDAFDDGSEKIKDSLRPALQFSIFLSLGTAVQLANAKPIQADTPPETSSIDQKVGSKTIAPLPSPDPHSLAPLIRAAEKTPTTYQASVGFAEQYQPKTHLVRRGDTISKIAREYKVSSAELIQLNRLRNANVIFVNQELKIPASSAQSLSIGSSNSPHSIVTAQLEPVEDISLAESETLAKTNLKLNSDDQKRTWSTIKDPHIARLRADIELLKSQYRKNGWDSQLSLNRNQFSTADLERNSLTISELESSTSSNWQQVADSGYELREDLIEEKELIALKLPPLVDSAEYLPEAEVFDGYIWPAKGVFTSGFGWRWGRRHNGIDIAAPIGSPILAAASGTVIDTGRYGGYGNLVKIEHLDGSVTLYAHLHRILVSNGQKVDQGELIAEMGNTGFSTGPHLHFEIHLSNKQKVDPLGFLPKR